MVILLLLIDVMKKRRWVKNQIGIGIVERERTENKRRGDGGANVKIETRNT